MTTLHGAGALAVLCGLLFLEESGVPLPLLPGDILLVVGGVLAAGGAYSVGLFAALSVIAMVAGAMVGHAWARALGRSRLDALAARLHGGRAVQRVAERLRRAGPGGITVCRLLPGLRVYTNLVAGAAGVERTTFAVGVLPSVLIWVAGFGGLGYAIGVPAERLIGSIESLLSTALAIVAVAVVIWLAVRAMPPSRRFRRPADHRFSWSRFVGAVVIDSVVVMVCLGAVAEVISETLTIAQPDGLVDVAIAVAVVCLGYVAVTRRGVGGTAGEAIFAVSYRGRGRRDVDQ